MTIGNIQARDVMAAEGNQTITQQMIQPPDIEKKVAQVRELLAAPEPKPLEIQSLLNEIAAHAPGAAKELYQACLAPLKAIGVILRLGA